MIVAFLLFLPEIYIFSDCGCLHTCLSTLLLSLQAAVFGLLETRSVTMNMDWYRLASQLANRTVGGIVEPAQTLQRMLSLMNPPHVVWDHS